MAGYDELIDRRKPVLRYVIGAGLVVLLGVLIWVAIAAVRNDSKTKPPASSSNTGSPSQNSSGNSSGQPIAPNSASGSSSSNSANNAGDQPSGQGSNPAPGAAASGSNSSQTQLADAGPGDVIILFLAASFLGWLIHYRHLKRNALR